MNVLSGVILVSGAGAAAWSQASAGSFPKWESFPVAETFAGNAVSPKLVREADWHFQRQIREEAAKGLFAPNRDGFRPLDDRLGSRLLIVRGCPEDKHCASYFYEWTGS